jgi:hypothetical protein
MKNTSCLDKHIYFIVSFSFLEGGVGQTQVSMPAFMLAYYAFPRWYEIEERWWNDILTGENRRTQRKTCHSATLSTTYPTWIDPGANPGGKRPATNDLSHGTAFKVSYKTNSLNMFGPISGGRNLPTLYGSCTLTSLTQRVLPDRQQCTQLLNFEPKYTCRYIH